MFGTRLSGHRDVQRLIRHFLSIRSCLHWLISYIPVSFDHTMGCGVLSADIITSHAIDRGRVNNTCTKFQLKFKTTLIYSQASSLKLYNLTQAQTNRGTKRLQSRFHTQTHLTSRNPHPDPHHPTHPPVSPSPIPSLSPSHPQQQPIPFYGH